MFCVMCKQCCDIVNNNAFLYISGFKVIIMQYCLFTIISCFEEIGPKSFNEITNETYETSKYRPYISDTAECSYVFHKDKKKARKFIIWFTRIKHTEKVRIRWHDKSEINTLVCWTYGFLSAHLNRVFNDNFVENVRANC